MAIDPNALVAAPPLHLPEPLYGFQYKRGGYAYSFKQSKLLATFGATEQQLQEAIVWCDAHVGEIMPDGPFKNHIVHTLTPDQQEEVREAYRKKLEAQKQTMMNLQNQPMTQPVVVPDQLFRERYVPPYVLEVGDAAVQHLPDYDAEWKSH